MNPPLTVTPMPQGQVTGRRRRVEIHQSSGRASLGTHLAATGLIRSAPIAVGPAGPAPQVTPISMADSNGTASWSTPILRWSEALERRFAHVAARIAASKATETERKEFAALQDARRRVRLARPGIEVLRDFEERQRTADLVEALQRYAAPY